MHGVLTNWECDRCGAKKEVAQGEQPRGWTQVVIGAVEVQPLHLLATPKELCDGCSPQHRRWLLGDKAPVDDRALDAEVPPSADPDQAQYDREDADARAGLRLVEPEVRS